MHEHADGYAIPNSRVADDVEMGPKYKWSAKKKLDFIKEDDPNRSNLPNRYFFQNQISYRSIIYSNDTAI